MTFFLIICKCYVLAFHTEKVCLFPPIEIWNYDTYYLVPIIPTDIY